MSRLSVIDAVEAELAGNPSYFRAALLREDLERLTGLLVLAADADDEVAFLKAAGLAAWTPGDLRTYELKPWLDPFLRAWYGAAEGDDPAGVEAIGLAGFVAQFRPEPTRYPGGLPDDPTAGGSGAAVAPRFRRSLRTRLRPSWLRKARRPRRRE